MKSYLSRATRAASVLLAATRRNRKERLAHAARSAAACVGMVEQLESRTLLSYTLSLTGQTATVSPVAATGGPFLIDAVLVAGNQVLEYSQDGGSTFSTNWDPSVPGTNMLAANSSSVINLTPTTGAGSSITLGDLSSPASNIFALVNLGVVGTPANNSLIIDDRSSTHAAGTYNFYSTLGSITGPGGTLGGINLTSFGPVNSYEILGGPAGNTFNIHSTFNATTASTTIIGGTGDTVNVLGDTSPGIGTPLNIALGGGTNTVNVGSGNIGTVISAPVAVTDTGGTTTLVLDDTADTTHATATLDDLSGNVSAPFEVSGLGGPIEYGTGVTAVNINGGTSASGTAGVTYDTNETQAGTTTTINGGAKANSYNLSGGSQAGGLDNLPGPVVINGGGAGDAIALDDADNSSNYNYTVTSTTVTNTGLFGGLTYGGLGAGGTLNLYATSGNNVIDVNSTADGVDTSVSGESGLDTINVNGTGTGASLFVSTGDATNQASTVNVLADSEAVDISSFASFPTVTTVNVGSTGGAGTMAGIQGAISVVNAPSLTSLNFHDENDTTGQTWTLDNDDSTPTGTVAVTDSATTTYDPADLSQLIVNGGSGGNEFKVNNTSGFYPTTLNTGTGNDTTYVYATGDNTLDVNGQDGLDVVDVGASSAAPLGAQGLTGTINVGNANGLTDLDLDDSEDTDSKTALLFNDGTNGQITGLSPATINYSDAGINSLTVYGGSGGNTFTVDGTLNNPPTDLYTGTGDDTTFVEATSVGPLNIYGQSGQDTVDIGFFGSLADIQGPVSVSNEFGFTDLTADASADDVSHTISLSSSVLDDSTLSGLAPATITYANADISSLTIKTSDFGNQVMNIDMSGGNPIPDQDHPGLIFDAGGDATSGPGSHVLNIFGTLPSGPFASETQNAESPDVGGPPHYGSIYFTDSLGGATSLSYTGLQPITDTTPAVNYTFNDDGYPDQSFSATTGPIVGGFQTLEFASTPTPVFPTNFETTDIANKNFVTFNTPPLVPGVPNNGIIGTANIPVASTGLLSLTFNTLTGGANNVSFVNTPPGVVTSLNDGAGSSTLNVTGLGVASGTVLFLDGGPGSNKLNYDAGGETPTVTPGLLPGEVLITIPGAGIVDVLNVEYVHITDTAPVKPTAGTAITLSGTAGHTVSGTIAEFHSSIPGVTAADFTATINYGDGSPTSGGVIIQDAVNPTLFYVTGSHVYGSGGVYTTTVSVRFIGSTSISSVNGVTVTTANAPANPVNVTGKADISPIPVVTTGKSITGNEGRIITPTVTTFTANPSAATSEFSATINWGDGYTTTGTIVKNSAGNFSITGTHTYHEENYSGYTVTVTLHDADGPTKTITDKAIIDDSPLDTPVGLSLSKSVNTTYTNLVLGSFRDQDATNTMGSDYHISINWGDNTTSSGNAVLTKTTTNVGTYWNVEGTHKYTSKKTYTVKITIYDTGNPAKTSITITTTIKIS